jgi:hypothetical protein
LTDLISPQDSIVTSFNNASPVNNNAHDWHQHISALLNELTGTQDELLQLLTQKREAMVASDMEAMEGLQERELQLGQTLQEIQDRRQQLLNQAKEQGLPADNLGAVLASVGDDENGGVGRHMQKAQSRSRVLQEHTLTNWVLAQKSLLHLSQLLEIIATGGRITPTYGEEAPATHSRGSLIDEAA